MKVNRQRSWSTTKQQKKGKKIKSNLQIKSDFKAD